MSSAHGRAPLFPLPTSPEFRAAMAAQYSFVMKGMTKTFPGVPKPILSNFNIQF
jgi:hypothetical protein